LCANRLSDSFIVRGENVRSQTAVTNHRNLITCEYKSHIWEIVVWQTLYRVSVRQNDTMCLCILFIFYYYYCFLLTSRCVGPYTYLDQYLFPVVFFIARDFTNCFRLIVLLVFGIITLTLIQYGPFKSSKIIIDIIHKRLVLNFRF